MRQHKLLQRYRCASLTLSLPSASCTTHSLQLRLGPFPPDQHDRGIELYERALRMQMRSIGEMHKDTAVTIGRMAASFCSKRQYSRALSEANRALRIFHAVLGPLHPDTQNMEQNLAQITLASKGGRGTTVLISQ